VKQTIRTFVAVETGAEVRKRAAELIERLGEAGADVNWVAPRNLHLTLKFLGDVALRETARVCEAVERAAREVEPFELEIVSAGAFPNVGRPRTVWLGSGQGEDLMGQLHQHVETRLQKLGFRKDARRYQTHLTIGRVRRGGPDVAELGRLIRENADFQAGRITVSEMIVFASRLDSTGPTYEPLGRAKLGGQNPQ
jgi:2'-5' RNA ligase